ncbi:unnamed protein product [Cylindrotheca closterium]|uniref:Uncharacterized protein n=1 Tax=Cylindrotheca closterium TaxID=2856 RepID=A0AAD2CNJ4_9STRA|nr:unnamed protein product [Cylindrotheca closterium]
MKATVLLHTHAMVCVQYDSIYTTIFNIYYFKQNESVNDYRRRFEAQADQLFEILGTDVLHVDATKTMGYLDLYDPEDDPDNTKALQDAFKKEVLETFKANASFYNCGRSRFQSMLDKANQTYTMEFKEYDQRNEYPTMIDQAAKALTKHKPDNRKKGPTTRTNTVSSSAPDGMSNAQATARTTSSRPVFSCWCCVLDILGFFKYIFGETRKREYK